MRKKIDQDFHPFCLKLNGKNIENMKIKNLIKTNEIG